MSSVGPVLAQQEPVNSASLRWTAAAVLPPGALLAVVSGDPASAGVATIRLSMPDGYVIPPHFHPSYEHVEILEGTLLAGMGDVPDPKQTFALSVGDTATAPAGMHHYSIARGRTVISATFVGPYTITYIRAEDAPGAARAKTFPLGY